jgi:hypothetical protein
MTYQQPAGRVKVPAGKKVAVSLGVDFDKTVDGTSMIKCHSCRR